MMKMSIIVLAALMLSAPQALVAQDEAPKAAEETVDREALRDELAQARTEVAQAARKLARIQRQLADDARGEMRVERLEELARLEALEGEMAGMEEHIHRRVIEGLRMTRPRLGVLLGGEEDSNAIVGVTPGSGAEKAGIKAGDRLVAINGQAVDAGDPDSLRAPLEGVEAGDAVPVKIERNGDEISLDVTVSSPARDLRVVTHNIIGPAPGAPDIDREVIVLEGEYERIPEPPMPPLPPRLAGLGRHSDLISNHAGLESYFGTAEGVVVLRIDAENPLKLEDGDVVLSIDGESVSRPVDIGRALLGRRGETVTLEVMRGGERITLDAELPEARAVSALAHQLHRGL